jgi:N-acetyl-gamma-glutamyl-phosphate reductase
VQTLSHFVDDAVELTFVPHLVPMIRGIQATLYAKKTTVNGDLTQLYRDFYQNEPFVDVLAEGTPPETRSVRSSNMCQISANQPKHSKRIIVLSVIDNLVKGAAGQAVQNMNLMLGFEETTALRQAALLP